MQVTIDITSDEAENLLFALALRSKQSKLSAHYQENATKLGRRLDSAFVTAFGWDPTIDRMKLWRKPIKQVSIKLYDLPPAEEN